jgi:hypothetical protein
MGQLCLLESWMGQLSLLEFRFDGSAQHAWICFRWVSSACLNAFSMDEFSLLESSFDGSAQLA